jgi:hypothetical protein
VFLSSAFRFAVFAALICTALIFFCPATAGPYACTHGPVTALRAQRLAGAIFSLLSVCATVVIQIVTAVRMRVIRHRERASTEVLTPTTERLSLCCSLLC